MRDNGKDIKRDGGETKLREYVKSLKWIASRNSAKAYRYFDSYVGGYIRYQKFGRSNGGDALLL